MPYAIKQKEFFQGISQIKFEGPGTDNPLAFRWYDENKVVSGKSLKQWLRFACAYWRAHPCFSMEQKNGCRRKSKG